MAKYRFHGLAGNDDDGIDSEYPVDRSGTYSREDLRALRKSWLDLRVAMRAARSLAEHIATSSAKNDGEQIWQGRLRFRDLLQRVPPHVRPRLMAIYREVLEQHRRLRDTKYGFVFGDDED